VQRGVSATGYIVAAEANGRINQPGHNNWCQLQDAINRWRHQVVLKIQAADLSNQGRAVLAALTIGDKRQITGLWNSLVRLGIVHLMIVSGLHVGLVAGFGFIIGGRAGSLLAAGCRLQAFQLY
jgi:competence protein ComEC